MNVPANKAIYKTVYRRVPRGASATVELTNKDDAKTTFSGSVYSDNVVFYIPSNYVTTDNLPATAVYKIGDVYTLTVNYDVTAPPSSGGGDGAISWTEVTGKPSVFPPNTHTHSQSQITSLTSTLTDMSAAIETKADTSYVDDQIGQIGEFVSNTVPALVTNMIADKADIDHTHTVANVTGLQTTLNSKISKTANYTAVGAIAGFHMNLELDYDTNDPQLLEPIMVKVRNGSGALDKSFWLNESGIPRASAIRKEEPALKLHGFSNASTGPVIEVRGKWSDGAPRRWGISGQGLPLLGENQIVGAHTIVLTSGAAVPAGLPAGTVIVRTS